MTDFFRWVHLGPFDFVSGLLGREILFLNMKNDYEIKLATGHSLRSTFIDLSNRSPKKEVPFLHAGLLSS